LINRLSLHLSAIELSVVNEGFVNVAQEIISIVPKTRYSKYGSYGRYDLAAYTAEITSRVEKINCVRATNERNDCPEVSRESCADGDPGSGKQRATGY